MRICECVIHACTVCACRHLPACMRCAVCVGVLMFPATSWATCGDFTQRACTQSVRMGASMPLRAGCACMGAACAIMGPPSPTVVMLPATGPPVHDSRAQANRRAWAQRLRVAPPQATVVCVPCSVRAVGVATTHTTHISRAVCAGCVRHQSGRQKVRASWCRVPERGPCVGVQMCASCVRGWKGARCRRPVCTAS
jgi:hypothetical protein